MVQRSENGPNLRNAVTSSVPDEHKPVYCACVRLSAHVSQEPIAGEPPNFQRILPVVVARFFERNVLQIIIFASAIFLRVTNLLLPERES